MKRKFELKRGAAYYAGHVKILVDRNNYFVRMLEQRRYRHSGSGKRRRIRKVV